MDHLDLRGVTRASKFLFIDWHQVFNRSWTGDAHFFVRTPQECVDTVVKTVRLGETLNKSLFVAILSYVDTDRRVNEVIEFLNTTDCSFSFVLITRRDHGNEGRLVCFGTSFGNPCYAFGKQVCKVRVFPPICLLSLLLLTFPNQCFFQSTPIFRSFTPPSSA